MSTTRTFIAAAIAFPGTADATYAPYAELGAVAGNFDGDDPFAGTTKPCVDLVVGAKISASALSTVGAGVVEGFQGSPFGLRSMIGARALKPVAFDLSRLFSFGRSLALTRVNGDRYDDLLVGIPDSVGFDVFAAMLDVNGGQYIFGPGTFFGPGSGLYGTPTLTDSLGRLPLSGSARGQHVAGFPGRTVASKNLAGSIQMGRWKDFVYVEMTPRVEDTVCSDCGPPTQDAEFGYALTRARPAFTPANP